MTGRRSFLQMLACLLGAPCTALAQQAGPLPRIGVLANTPDPLWDVFRRALAELGYVEGRSVSIEWRYSRGMSDRLPALAEELIQAKVDVIVVSNTQAARVLKQASTTVPVVMTSSAFPDKVGLVQSLARPGGNITGLSNLAPDMLGKGFQFLKEIAPDVVRVATIWNPNNPTEVLALAELPGAGRPVGIEIHSFEARSPDEHTKVLAGIAASRMDALFALGNPVNYSGRQLIVDFALRSRLPSLFQLRPYVEVGGLLSYAPSYAELYARSATFVDKILKGATPASLPIEQPTKIELVINQQTARTLGLAIPAPLRLLGEVI